MVAILDHMSALSDPTRCRMLLLLEKHELTVSELCCGAADAAVQVSRHLKTLADDDWVASRRDGTSRFYTHAARRPRFRRQAAVAADSRAGRLDARRRAGRSPSSRRARRGAARSRRNSSRRRRAEWDRLRGELFGDAFYLWAVLGLIDPTLVVGDLGCGTGQLTETVAPYVRRVIASTARPTCSTPRGSGSAARRNVDIRQGELESLPIDDRRARRGDAVAGAALLAGAGARAGRSGARGAARADACSSSTCCRTTARSISSRWATCGSGFRRSRSSSFLTGAGFDECARPDAAGRSRREGAGAVRRDRSEAVGRQRRAGFETGRSLTRREQWQQQ